MTDREATEGSQGVARGATRHSHPDLDGLADALRGVRAIAFGQCTDCPAESDDGARTLDEVVAEAADILGVPCVIGLPFGHVADQWTLPLGALAELDSDAGTLHVEW